MIQLSSHSQSSIDFHKKNSLHELHSVIQVERLKPTKKLLQCSNFQLVSVASDFEMASLHMLNKQTTYHVLFCEFHNRCERYENRNYSKKKEYLRTTLLPLVKANKTKS